MTRSAFWSLPQALAWLLRKDLELVRWLANTDDVGALHHALEQREWDTDVDGPEERTLKDWDIRADRDQEEKRKVVYEEKEEIKEHVIVHGQRIGEEIEAAIWSLVEAARSGEVPAIDRGSGRRVRIPPAAVKREPIGYDRFWATISFPSAEITAKWKPSRTKVDQITLKLVAWLKEYPGSTKGDAREWYDSNYQDHPAYQFDRAWRDAPSNLKRGRGKRGPQKTSK